MRASEPHGDTEPGVRGGRGRGERELRRKRVTQGERDCRGERWRGKRGECTEREVRLGW